MNHLTEEELIGYRDGERKSHERIAIHLSECAECREEMTRVESVFAALNAMLAPEPGEDYEQRVWQQIAPRLAEKSPKWWEGLFAPRRLVAMAAFAVVIALAFLMGRLTRHPGPDNTVADSSKVGERVLVVAVGEHLGRSEMVLMELENAQPAQQGQKVDMSATQRRAEDLLQENRLYRQTALREGDQPMASTLDELERVLLDIANSPDTVTSSQFETLRKRIEDQGILFKVRVVNQDLQKRNKPANSAPAKNESAVSNRSKT
jgi:anti-sigma factor RsiW